MKDKCVLFILLLLAVLIGCSRQDDSNSGLTRVNVAMHANAAGASLISVAIDQGFFRKYGIDARLTIVESGPVQMAAMRADNPTLDFGYIGAGVAWNPIDSTGNSLTFIFFDILSNAERLLARRGIFEDRNGNGVYDHEEIHAGLRGRTVFLEIGATPAGWFRNLVDAVNKNFAQQDMLWLHCEDAGFLEGYTAPNNNPANRVLVVNYANANIPAGMATLGANAVDIAVAFEPVPSTILRTVRDIELIADISALPEDKVFPSTIVANTRWLRLNPELARNAVFAMYEAAVWRANNPTEAVRIAERLSARPTGTFLETTQYFPTSEDYREWFSAPNALGWSYLRSLYRERLPNIPQGTTPKSFEEAFDMQFMLDAIRELQ